eukprot:TRINITY_DN3909_c0_g1_i3.p1 TRINITY_DN3909_c0_g1~~TRINITY_DN3909_c0_g1_i3.p1  ORF type:complete len:530 (-),score=70.21 TRINITY_DN3909_c0_g1_i3:39-1556(-)
MSVSASLDDPLVEFSGGADGVEKTIVGELAQVVKSNAQTSPMLFSPSTGRRAYVSNAAVASQQDGSKKTGRQVAVCFVIMFAEGFFATQIFPYVGFMMSDIGISEHNVGFVSGLIFTSFSIGNLISSLQWAKLSNNIGRRKCITMSCSIQVLLTCITAFADNLIVLVGVRFVCGLTNCILPIMRTALRESFVMWREDDTQAFAIVQVAFGASCVAGPSLGGLLYGKAPLGLTPWALPTLISTVLYTFAAVLTARFLVDAKEDAPTSISEAAQKPAETERKSSVSILLTDPTFLLVLIMGGGHSSVFTGWELAYPLFARLKHEVGGEQWSTAQIGVTFLVGSFGLMFYSLGIFPRLSKGRSQTSIWIGSWVAACLIMPLAPRLISRACDTANKSSALGLHSLNYGAQMIISVCLGSGFIVIQLQLNRYVSPAHSAVANSCLASVQSVVRAITPPTAGTLLSIGLAREKDGIFGVSRSLPFDVFCIFGLLSCIVAAVAFGKRTNWAI